MPPKKKGESAGKLHEEGPGVDGSDNTVADRESLLQREYDNLTDTFNNLKRKVEKLRRENEFLENETNQTRVEREEYMSYISKYTQQRQNAIITLSDQHQQELEALKRQREETLEKYQEQASELKKEILEKEKELALLKIEIAELGDFKGLQKQQLQRLAELETVVSSMHSGHCESLQALKSGFLREKERHEAQANNKVQALALTANREATCCLLSFTNEVSLENQCLREELKQLMERSQSLRDFQNQLQTQRQHLLLEREYVTKLRHVRGTQGTPAPGSQIQPLGDDGGDDLHS